MSKLARFIKTWWILTFFGGKNDLLLSLRRFQLFLREIYQLVGNSGSRLWETIFGRHAYGFRLDLKKASKAHT